MEDAVLLLLVWTLLVVILILLFIYTFSSPVLLNQIRSQGWRFIYTLCRHNKDEKYPQSQVSFSILTEPTVFLYLKS